jgi:hypothetical protein
VKTVKTWHGDPELKATVVNRMRAHRAQDDFIQGAYQVPNATDNGYKGCAIGCMLEYDQASTWPWHFRVERQFGIPAALAAVIDDTFEEQPDFQAAGEFALAVVEAIPVGVELREVDIDCEATRTPSSSCRCLICHCFRVSDVETRRDWDLPAEDVLNWLTQLTPPTPEPTPGAPVLAPERVLEPVA